MTRPEPKYKNVDKWVYGEVKETSEKTEKLKNNFSIITVCHRTQPKSNIPTRKSVERKLQGGKIETMARKYLRDLRRNAFVENRL